MNHKQPTSTAVKTAEEIFESVYSEEFSSMLKLSFKEACCKIAKIYANAKLDEAANNIDWENCYDGGCHCGRDAHEKNILSLKDEI